MNILDYDKKMNDILNSDQYKSINEDPITSIEPKVYNTLFRYKNEI